MEVGYDGPVCIEVEGDTFGRTVEGRQRALRVARNGRPIRPERETPGRSREPAGCCDFVMKRAAAYR